jgi:deoxyribonuclease V
LWRPGREPIVIAGAFVAFARGEEGPGQAGDRAFVGAAATRETEPLASVVIRSRAGSPYRPGLLAAREGLPLAAAIRALLATGVRPDVVLVDATGRDHPRRAGLALHLGAVLDLPSVGVTQRALLATGDPPPDDAGASSPLTIGGDVVGRWFRPHAHVRPIAVHAAWRTDDAVAVEVVRRATGTARTPEPLRLARIVARTARSAGG